VSAGARTPGDAALAGEGSGAGGAATRQPARVIGRGAAVALVFGNMVGVGIFLTPSEVARASPDVVTYLALWIVGGVMALAGAQVAAELGSLFPHAGGDYVFLDRAFGRGIARAWGLLSAVLSFPGSIATLAVGAVGTLATASFGAWLAEPVVTAGPATLAWKDLLALGVVWAATALNVRGVTLAGRVQAVLTWTPIAVFLGIAIWLVVAGVPAQVMDVPVRAPGSGSGPAFSGLAAAFCAVFFTFSGWNVLTYVGGEVKAPGRTIPVAILTAVVLASAAYLVLNAAFLLAIPLATLPGVPNAGVATADRLFGTVGADAFAAFMAMSILAGLNSTVMAGSRISLAIAGDGYLWRRMADIDERRGTPAVALAVQAVIASAMVLTGSFSLLVTATGGVIMLLSCVTIASIFVFRARMKLVPPTPMFGYPWTAAAFLAIGAIVIVLGFVSGGIWPVVGLAAVALLVGVPAVAARMSTRRGAC